MSHVMIVGHKDPTNFTAGVVFERNEDDTIKTAAYKGQPVELSADQVKYLEDDGFILETVTKAEAEKIVSGDAAAGDVVGAAPVLGNTSSNPAPGRSLGEDESNDQGGSKSGSGKSK